jgi:hypothetical protein
MFALLLASGATSPELPNQAAHANPLPAPKSKPQ